MKALCHSAFRQHLGGKLAQLMRRLAGDRYFEKKKALLVDLFLNTTPFGKATSHQLGMPST